MFCTSLYITLLKCPVKLKTLYLPWERGTETLQGLSGHIMLNCSNRRFCIVLWQQNGGAGSATETLSLSWAPSPTPGSKKQPIWVAWGSTVVLPDLRLLLPLVR